MKSNRGDKIALGVAWFSFLVSGSLGVWILASGNQPDTVYLGGLALVALGAIIVTIRVARAAR